MPNTQAIRILKTLRLLQRKWATLEEIADERSLKTARRDLAAIKAAGFRVRQKTVKANGCKKWRVE